MLTPAKLRSLSSLPNTTLSNNYNYISSKFIFANPARIYSIIYNNKEDILISKSENSDYI